MNELIRAIEKGRLYNGYIICSKEMSAAVQAAKEVAAAAHTEPYMLEEPNMESIRTLQTNLLEDMQIGDAKVAVIFGDKLSDQCQNAMLKTIEEHSENVTIIIVTTNIAHILPTIVSRCITYYPPVLSEQELTELSGGDLLAARYAMGSGERARELCENPGILAVRDELCALMSGLKQGMPYYKKGIGREEVNDLLRYMLLFLRDCLTKDIHWFFDKKELVGSYINTFTTEQFIVMIKEVKSAEVKINTNTNPALVLSSVQAAVLEVINGNSNRG